MGQRVDVVIIGAGHNGLTAAAYLARAGRKVLVLERRGVLGGIAATEEVWPGFRFSPVEQDCRLVPRLIRDELRLAEHGFRPIPLDPMLTLQTGDGAVCSLPRDMSRTAAGIQRLSARDAQRLPEFDTLVRRLAGVVRQLHRTPMPDLAGPGLDDLMSLLHLGRAFRKLGEKDMWAALRVMPMRVSDLLDEWFESHAIKAAIACDAILHQNAGPRSAGTAFSLLRQRLGADDGAFAAGETCAGGLGGLANALAQSAGRAGAEIRTEAPVRAINVERGRAVGVTLGSGDTVDAAVVVSGADPKQTLLRLVDPLQLDAEFVNRVRYIGMRGVASRVNLALAGLPRLRGAEGSNGSGLGGRLVLAPHLDELERAYDCTKYGRLSDRPLLIASLPSVSDPSLAPAGQHVMCVHLQFTPYHLREGDWDALRNRLQAQVLDRLEESFVEVRSLVLHSQVLTPLDLERTWALTEGHITHGDSLLSQVLYMRPTEGCGGHNTPIENLYLCGAGTHPGGTVTCEPGRLAAGRILKR